MEIFFDPTNGKKGFRQIMVNTLGAVNDMKSDGGEVVPWDSGVKAAVKKNADSWAVEMAVPMSSITQDTVKGGNIWGLNICRTPIIGKEAEHTCWSPTFGGFQQPDKFGSLLFK